MKRDSQLYIWLILLFVSIVVVTGFYIWNFSSHAVSNSPADWGALGDYFGGVLNPLISIFTMFFLIKTYFTQRKELEGSEALNREQMRIQVLQAKIASSYELMAVYRHELDRAVNSWQNNLLFISLEGDEISPGNNKEYRNKVVGRIKLELEKAKHYQEELDK